MANKALTILGRAALYILEIIGFLFASAFILAFIDLFSPYPNATKWSLFLMFLVVIAYQEAKDEK